ncbi:MAG: T9SS type A sorting domain-containing protein [Bacteroidota bacterium]
MNIKITKSLLANLFLIFISHTILAGIPPGKKVSHKSPDTISLASQQSVYDFESGNQGWTDSTLSGSSWMLGTPAYGTTTGAYSGVNAWDVDLTQPYAGNTLCWLTSPVFDLSNVPFATISFNHNFSIEPDWDGTTMEITTDSGLTWNVLGSVNDSLAVNWFNVNSFFGVPTWSGNSNGWITSSYNISNYAGLPAVQFRFVFSSDGSFSYDGHSIDDFKIYPFDSIDLAVDDINLPDLIVAGYPVTPEIKIVNIGLTTVNNYDVDVSLNGNLLTTLNFNTPLQSGDTVIINNYAITPIDSIYNICATVHAIGDTTIANNIYCKAGLVLFPEPIPFFTDFETSSPYWSALNITPSGPTTNWTYGNPATVIFLDAFSDTMCSFCANDASPVLSYLYSPTFRINSAPVRVSFENKYRLLQSEGVYINYEINNSGIWNTLGSANDPEAFNWYNDTNAVFAGAQHFSGIRDWALSYINMKQFLPADSIVRFRFVDSKTDSVYDSGYFLLDDFKIEYLPSTDIAIIDILNGTGVIDSSSQSKVVLRNYGGTDATGFTVKVLLNGVTKSTFIYTDTLSAGETDTIMPAFTITALYNEICALVIAANDNAHFNDTLCKDEVGGMTLVTLPYSDDFEGTALWQNLTTGNNLTNWELGQPNYGATSDAHSGSYCWDINLNDHYYDDARSYLYSPFFETGGRQLDTLSFWQNYNTETGWDGTSLEYRIDFNGAWTPIAGWTGNSNGWMQNIYNLSGIVSGSIIQFRFLFTSDGLFDEDGYSIDDFYFNAKRQSDIEVLNVVSPATSITQGTIVNLEVTIKNNGYAPTGNCNIYYSLNGNSPTAFPFTQSLVSGATAIINLGQLTTIPGPNSLLIYTDWIADEVRLNDTIRYNFISFSKLIPPYSNDFESSIYGWSESNNQSGTLWQYGSPSYGVTSSSHSGNKSWDTNLSTACSNNAIADLYTPAFDFTSMVSPQIFFWMNYGMQNGFDGARVQYTTDDLNWNVLGGFNDPLGMNWYNISNVVAFNVSAAWSGINSGWLPISHDLSFLDGQSFVRFSFQFKSSASSPSNGITMDDFMISEVSGTDDYKSALNVSVFPNPASTEIYIKTSNENGNINYSLYATDGMKVSVNSTSTKNMVIMDVRSISPGIYIVKVENENGTAYRKIVKL